MANKTIIDVKKQTKENIEIEVTDLEIKEKEQIKKEFEIHEIELKLIICDSKLPRHVEDLISIGSLPTNEYIDATIKEKESLRIQLKELEG